MSLTPDREREAFRYLCRHLVTLCGWWESVETGGPVIRPYSDTGCVLDFGGEWFIATSGHCVQEMVAAANAPRVRVGGQVLADRVRLGEAPAVPVPFRPLDHPHYYVDDERAGVDFGLIHLRPLYRAGVEASGVMPFGPAHWTIPPGLRFEGHCVVGFPAEDRSGEHTPDGRLTACTVRPRLIPLREVPDDSLTRVPRFRGEIRAVTTRGGMFGMSGGPVLGFYHDGPDVRYRLIALQSRVSPDRTEVYACRVEEFFKWATAQPVG